MSNKIPTPPPAKNIKLKSDTNYVDSIIYEYVYGIKDIAILDKQYEKSSVFVSKPYQVEGNVMQVALNTKEEHPVFYTDENLQPRHTSTEYYVTHTLNPTIEQWYSILPEEQRLVLGEYLLFDDTKRARLRFPCNTNKTVNIYCDGVRLDPDDWSFMLNGSGDYQIYISRNFNSHAYYTIDYYPDNSIRDPWTVDFQKLGAKPLQYINKDGVSGQIFEGTNHNGMVELEFYPYIDYDTINNTPSYNPNTSAYKPLQIILEDAKIIAPNKTVHTVVEPYNGVVVAGKAYTKNVTDYNDTEKEYILKPYDAITYPFFEYYQKGRRIYFSETFNKSQLIVNNGICHGNANIRIQYQYLVSNVRTKAILRRMDTSSQGITPMIHQYSLKFKVMK
jgi:hypothetical protein